MWKQLGKRWGRVCPGRAAVRELVQPRAGAPLSCRALAGLEGRSQAALHRNACLRKTFASSFAAVRKRSVCTQIKLQAVSALRVGGVVAQSWDLALDTLPLPYSPQQ